MSIRARMCTAQTAQRFPTNRRRRGRRLRKCTERLTRHEGTRRRRTRSRRSAERTNRLRAQKHIVRALRWRLSIHKWAGALRTSLRQEPVMHEARSNAARVGEIQCRKMRVNAHPFSVIYSSRRARDGAGCAASRTYSCSFSKIAAARARRRSSTSNAGCSAAACASNVSESSASAPRRSAARPPNPDPDPEASCTCGVRVVSASIYIV
jgi:hypothetical protein